MLRLLALSPTVIDAIVQLGDPLSEPIVTERQFRSLVELNRSEQTERLRFLRPNGECETETEPVWEAKLIIAQARTPETRPPARSAAARSSQQRR